MSNTCKYIRTHMNGARLYKNSWCGEAQIGFYYSIRDKKNPRLLKIYETNSEQIKPQ